MERQHDRLRSAPRDRSADSLSRISQHQGSRTRPRHQPISVLDAVHSRRVAMEHAKAVEAARLLVEARRTGVPIKELPQDIRPLVAAESNQIVNEVTKMLGHDVAGWKITFLYKQRAGPFASQYTSHTMFSRQAQ